MGNINRPKGCKDRRVREMFEKVNPAHPDKVADRIAGALVDLAYTKEANPKIAVEVLIGHDNCHIIVESSVDIKQEEAEHIVERIAGKMSVDLQSVKQDVHLAENQSADVRCGDNGIFKGMPLTGEEKLLTAIAKELYADFKCDGKYIIDLGAGMNLTICQSNATEEQLAKHYLCRKAFAKINPLGYWTGGTDVDTGATNRKLGSDMGRSVTGGGLHGKDLSKADVTLNIYAFQKAQKTGLPVEITCSIGDAVVDGKPYALLVEEARKYIKAIGGFEKFAEWGLIN